MWFFKSPQIIFGTDALSHLDQIQGKRAFIVTDRVIQSLGFVDSVRDRLSQAGIDSQVFMDVQPDPSLATVRACAAAMQEYSPDWIVGLGGGSCLDAAKAAWFVYERPDVDLQAINPVEHFGLRTKARLITIPTTAGSGAEVSQAAVISDLEARRKLELATYELVADLTIVDPQFSAQMPPQLTADSGIDVLSHALEGYNNQWSNDFTDGLCLHATRLVFKYLPRAVQAGALDAEAREKMANAATMAGMVICNSNIALAHALGHSAGAILKLPHGRVTALFLPRVIEYAANKGFGRYMDIACLLNLPAEDELQASRSVSAAICELMEAVGLPVSLRAAGVPPEAFEAELEALCDGAEMDLGYVMSLRIPDRYELEQLFKYAYDGLAVNL